MHVGGERVATRRAVGRVINVAGSDDAARRVRHVTGFERQPTPARRSRAGSDSGRRRQPARSRSGRRTVRAARARPRRAGSAAWPAARREPASSQAIESQTRTVIAGGDVVSLFDHVEVVVERRHFVDLRHRHLHLGRERDQMPRLTGSRSGPESCAGARSADHGGAAHRRAGRALPRAPSDRRAALSAWNARGLVCRRRNARGRGWRGLGPSGIAHRHFVESMAMLPS